MERYRYRRAAFQTGFRHKISIAVLPCTRRHGGLQLILDGPSLDAMFIRSRARTISGLAQISLRFPLHCNATSKFRFHFQPSLSLSRSYKNFWISLPRTRLTVRKVPREARFHSNKRLLRHDFHDTISHFHLFLGVRWGCRLAYVLSEFALC